MNIYPLIICLNQTTLGDFVSIGIAAFIGRDLYLETKEGWDDRDLPAASRDLILESLDSGYCVPLSQVGDLLLRYLAKYGERQVQIYSDTPKETEKFLKQVLTPWPSHVRPRLTPLYPTSSLPFEKAYRRNFGSYSSEYQALDRAQALRKAFNEIQKN